MTLVLVVFGGEFNYFLLYGKMTERIMAGDLIKKNEKKMNKCVICGK